MFLEKINQNLVKTVYFIYGSIFLVIMGLLLAVDKKIEYFGKDVNVTILSNLILLPIGVLLFLLPLYCFRKKDVFKKLNIYKLLIIFSVILLVVQVVVVYNIYFYTEWDVKGLLYTADLLAPRPSSNPNTLYFQIYPNNIFLLFIMTVLKQIAMALSINSYPLILIVCMSLANISVLLIGLILYKLTKNKLITIIGYILSTMLIGLSPWITIPYSDIFSILIPVLTLFIYVHIRNVKMPVFIKTFLIVIIPIIGYLVKPQCVIILIAIAICEFLYINFNTIKPKNIAMILLAVALAGVSFSAVSGFARSYTMIPEDKNEEFPLTHFMMMGLNEERSGVYFGDDVLFTQSFKGKEVKQEKNIEVIKDRLSNMGVAGLTKHLMKKTLINFNDGMFAWGIEGVFYDEVLPEKNQSLSPLLRNIYYHNGSYYKYLVVVEQMLWITALFLGLAMTFFKRIKGYEKEELIIILSIIGITLFSTIFEARARYLFLYTPIFVICGMIGLYKINEKLFKKREK